MLQCLAVWLNSEYSALTSAVRSVTDRMKIGVIVEGLKLSRWQAEALRALPVDAEFVILNCTNSRSPRRPFRHAGYYALRAISLSSRITRRIPLPPQLQVADKIDFECQVDGSWQSLPTALLNRIRTDDVDVVVKFGMGLLRVPSDLRIPILSYHHGDPRAFRGRPAGFYELLEGRSTVGQMIQRLSNRLDAGEVVAYLETKAYPYSWRRTMSEAYRCSPLLLPPAVQNAMAGVTEPIVPNGRNYRLPSNALAIRFAAGRFAALVKRIAYGLFVEKCWQIAEAPIPTEGADHLIHRFPPTDRWHVVSTPRRYRFLADPFYGEHGEILAEGFRRSGRGEIVRLANGGLETVSEAAGHFSYPATLHLGGTTFVLPEMSEWSLPHLYRLRDGRMEDLGELELGNARRLIDPTLYFSNGTFFLFANAADESLAVLRLWFSDAPLGPWREHPCSPVRISPAGSRMAGSIMSLGGKTIRLGQDLRGQYGNGVLFFEITDITRHSYSEQQLGELQFADSRGPHTINLGEGSVVFDFYRQSFSPLAGVRRLTSRLSQTNRLPPAAFADRLEPACDGANP